MMQWFPSDVKRKAHSAFSRAIREGRLVRPSACSGCGGEKRVEGHHPDYSRPLDVEWLCRQCHAARHAGPRPKAPKHARPPMPEPLLRPEEVAAIIGMTPKEVRAMCRPGGIPHFRLSAQMVRFDRTKVEAWLVNRPAA